MLLRGHFRVPSILENSGIFLEPGKHWETLEFNENLKKALENPGIYFECYFKFSVIEIRVMFYLLSSNLKFTSLICVI